MTLEIGQACDFPFHVFTAPQMLLHAPNASIEAAVRATIKIGGENANRGSFVASVLAAAGGETPEAWLRETTRSAEVRRLAERAVDGGFLRAPVAPARPGAANFGNAPGCVGHANGSDWNGTAPPSHPDDVRALSALYRSTGGSGWTRNACWLNLSVPVCWWDQVACKDGRVQQLRLASNNLVGEIDDAALEGLDGLEILQVGFNPKLTGAIPRSAASLPRLKHLYAWNASLEAVAALPPSLDQLDLADNALEAPLPDALADLANVTFVDASGNPGACPESPAVATWVKTRDFGFGC